MPKIKEKEKLSFFFMNKINVEEIDKKWQTFWSKKKINLKNTDKKKNFIVLKCFLIHREKFIWDT